MNTQEFFDKTVAHLRTQGGPAFADSDTCAYFGAAGRRCAIGVHITKEVYHPSMEMRRIDVLLDDPGVGPRLRAIFGDVTPGLLSEAQALHDNHRNYATWAFERDVRELAERYDLVYPEPAQFVAVTA